MIVQVQVGLSLFVQVDLSLFVQVVFVQVYLTASVFLCFSYFLLKLDACSVCNFCFCLTCCCLFFCTIRLFLFLFFFSTKKFQGLSNRATTWVSKSSRESCPHPCKSRQYQGTSASTMRQALLSNKGSSAGARIATPRDPYRVPTAGLSHVARASTILHVARASVELMWFVPQRCACHSG